MRRCPPQAPFKFHSLMRFILEGSIKRMRKEGIHLGDNFLLPPRNLIYHFKCPPYPPFPRSRRSISGGVSRAVGCTCGCPVGS
jgi:hypothetical protein